MVSSFDNDIIQYIEGLHNAIRKNVRISLKNEEENLNQIVAEGNGDVTYKIDAHSEQIIDAWFLDSPPDGGAVVVCEGLGKKIYPEGTKENDAKWYILIDPLDGTRHIMYNNRSCWILTGIAENKQPCPLLSDIQYAVQTEVPTTLQDKGIVLSAIRGQGAFGKVVDLQNNLEIGSYKLTPSTSDTLENGFAVFTNFFPGTKEVISSIEENVFRDLYGEPRENGALIFSEQYISNAGQLFMSVSGKYRMVADFRAELASYQHHLGKALPLCTHPYDLSASLIAEEAGCIVINSSGDALDYPMDLHTNCAWYCYANQSLKDKVHPVIVKELYNRGILASKKVNINS